MCGIIQEEHKLYFQQSVNGHGNVPMVDAN